MRLSPPYKLEPDPPPRGEDLPYDDGEPLESERHLRQMTLLIGSLGFAWSARRDFYVNGNMFVYYSATQSRRNEFRGPDVFVVLGTERRERRSWVVWEEDGKLPDVVIELTSPSTEAIDRGAKMKLYADVWRLPEYFIFDPWTGALDGYELHAGHGRYVGKSKDARGWVRSDRLGLTLGQVESEYGGLRLPWLRWISDEGKPLPTPEEWARAEANRAAAEANRVKELATRLAEYEAAYGTLPKKP